MYTVQSAVRRVHRAPRARRRRLRCATRATSRAGTGSPSARRRRSPRRARPSTDVGTASASISSGAPGSPGCPAGGRSTRPRRSKRAIVVGVAVGRHADDVVARGVGDERRHRWACTVSPYGLDSLGSTVVLVDRIGVADLVGDDVEHRARSCRRRAGGTARPSLAIAQPVPSSGLIATSTRLNGSVIAVVRCRFGGARVVAQHRPGRPERALGDDHRAVGGDGDALRRRQGLPVELRQQLVGHRTGGLCRCRRHRGGGHCRRRRSRPRSIDDV